MIFLIVIAIHNSQMLRFEMQSANINKIYFDDARFATSTF